MPQARCGAANHNNFQKARPLYEEGAAKALEALEDAWVPEALALAQRAEQVFPDSGRLMGGRVQEARALTRDAGLLPPEPDPS